MTHNLELLDYVILVLYLGGTLALGLWLGRSIKTGEDYFLAGRRLPWWAIGMSLVATDIGGTDIIGVGGAAYTFGMAVANFEWIGCVPAMIIASFIFIPFFYRTGIYTIPEFMERRYNAAVRVALAFCWLAFMACNLGIMLYASALMLSQMFGWYVIFCIIVTAFLVGLYTFAGGLAAVVYTDMIQCAVMIGGCLLVLILGIQQVGGLENLQTRIRKSHEELAQKQNYDMDNRELDRRTSEHTALILPVDTDGPFPWTGIFFGLALILSPAYWIGNQAIVQRSLGAKSDFEAKAAYIWGAVLKNIIPIIIAVPGVVAFALYPDLESGDAAFPKLVAELLPVGLRGLFLSAFIAALMSSIDSYLNSASTIVTNDVYKRFINPTATNERIMWMGRYTTVALTIWAVLFAYAITYLDQGVYAIFQTLMAFFQGPALAILMTGILWRRGTGIGAFTGFVVGVLFSISLYSLNQPAVYKTLGLNPLFQIKEPFLYFSIWAFLVALAIHIIVSYCTKPEPEEKLAGLIYGSNKSKPTQERA